MGQGEKEGEREALALHCCYSQGLPATCHAIQGLEKLGTKQRNSAKKATQKTIETRFPGERLHTLDSLQDGGSVLRFISNQKRRAVVCRDMHPHLLAESTQFIPSKENEEVGTLEVSGYVRGRPLSVNGLLHIPGLGDFQMTQITAPPDPHPVKARLHRPPAVMDTGEEREGMAEEIKVVAVADPAKQESLDREVELDPMEGEQTWPTEEELAGAVSRLQTPPTGQPLRPSEARRVPRGTSDYQAAWIVADSEDEDEEEGSEGEEVPVDDESEMDTESVTYGDTEKYDAQFDMEAEEQQFELLRAERENAMFPDEVDTPQDTPARIRFQKYRGVKSFRTSPWHPRENLPRDYAKIFQFENFSRTKKRVLSQEDNEAALPGWYVTVQVKDVLKPQAEALDPLSKPLVVFGLLEHENKMSVVHFVLRRCDGSSAPVKSKERLVFHCGLRRFSASPVFSQHTTGDKQKYERFFPREGVCVATVFAPIGYPPQPVLVFKPVLDTHQLLAVGTLYKVDPDRVVCKRIVLSGHPFKIHKRSAVIRYMFFNRGMSSTIQ
ncbi:Pre-rRNA-processing protein TSR1 homolog [Geodia barretti]|uniref:Pre-rRNA-processing protein TSR1 homolog n=1 Tax=Geodia barretti TaxID=519541 RepID=A0AA35X3B7_GEOBA|nr:Pre-rRNA-processing protein TSR1 homolog [Geodia barretti]